MSETHSRISARRNRGLSRRGEPLLLEVAWEVCNQVGGIYTVLRSKVPSMVNRWGSRYVLVGPYIRSHAQVEFEPTALTGMVGQAVGQLQDQGIEAHYGRWLVTGRPHVVLLNHLSLFPRLNEIKYRLWEEHNIGTPGDDELLNNVVAFGELCRLLLHALAYKEAGRRKLVAHFHEWLAGVAVPMLRREQWPGSVVFTTHATVLGRSLAMNDEQFHQRLPSYNAQSQAARYNLQPQHHIEQAAAHGAHVFTTVSQVTAEECTHLLGRTPDLLLPNGLNIQRFTVLHEFQNLHAHYKQRIHRFTMGHFFPSYSFDLDKTVYFFTSGRYEYRNKGMDLTIEALARLNHLLKLRKTPINVVMFIVTRRPIRSINVTALQSNATLQEFETIADAIKEQIGEKLFQQAAAGQVGDLNAMVDEYWNLRLRRAIHAWQRDQLPAIVTHDLQDDQNDHVLHQLRISKLWNQPDQPVKIVYHPEFITTSNPLFGLEYDQFVRGCHLGVFPSYYEPWGYTPLESIALGVPAVTSDLAGFGAYLQDHAPQAREQGVYVLPRRDRSFDQSADDLAHHLLSFCQLDRRGRIDLRNRVERFSGRFDWEQLAIHYDTAHKQALAILD